MVGPLLLSAASETWFGYRGQRDTLSELLQAELHAAANRIETFMDEIRDQLGWVVQLPWIDGQEEAHRIDALRLLRQVPAISSITLTDESGTERAFVSRLGLQPAGSWRRLVGFAGGHRRARQQGLVRPGSLRTRFASRI